MYEQGDFRAAARSYEEALEVRANDAYARDHLGLAQQQKATRAAAGEARTEASGQRARTAGRDKVYTVVDEQPKLIGGLEGLHKKVEYPRRAARAGVEGRVTVQMTVTADGAVRRPRVLQGIGGGCDEEALRVIQEARFEPAVLDGEAVPSQHSLWVQFRLEK